MRINTKLKHLLFKYRVELSRTDDVFRIELTDTHNSQKQAFESTAYREVIDNAYDHMKKELTNARKDLH